QRQERPEPRPERQEPRPERQEQRERPERQERQERAERTERPEPVMAEEPVEERRPAKKLNAAQEKFKGMINELASTSKARLIGASGGVVKEVPVKELVNTLKEGNAEPLNAIVFDGIVTQRILDIAAEQKIGTIIGTKMGNITKQPANVEVWTKDDLN
ncbi:MAG TPA: DNA primase, partial [Methanomassiliicoccales archaeon]|nr:DNA primase [Methanomassiliicoccales archaeon]